MKNISLNFQLLQCRYFLRTGQNSISFNSVKFFLNSFFECQTARDYNFQRKSLGNVRFLSTSYNKLNKSIQEVSSVRKNNDISIIYCGSLTHRVKGVKVFTCITSIGGFALQPFLVQNIYNGKDLPVGIALMTCLGFFTFVTPFLCHFITKKYVTEIWYNSATDTYTAIMLSFFLRRINMDFKISDITVPDIPPLFSNMCVKGRPILIMADSFIELSHFKKMMGYDKPIDVKPDMFNNRYIKSQKKEESEIM